MSTVTPITKELSVVFSEDGPGTHLLLQRAMDDLQKEAEFTIHCSSGQLLDILLKEKLSKEPVREPAPDMIIAVYSELFCDLKIIADLRKRERFSKTPIVVFVNENITQTHSKFLEYGVTAVLEKHVTYRGFKNQIHRVIRNHA